MTNANLEGNLVDFGGVLVDFDEGCQFGVKVSGFSLDFWSILMKNANLE